jgi:glycosyltransferase involved in cell wall biosynthesis
MNSGRPRVSVGIPAYNGSKFIETAIESVLAQSWDDFELYVIDDSSTDGTADKVRRIQDPRLRLSVNGRNVGQEANWNKVLRQARGEFIKLLPQDDVLDPDCLRRQIQVFDDPENSEVVLTCCARKIIDAKGRLIMKRSFKKTQGRIKGLRAVRRSIRSGTNLIGEPGAVLMRADLLPKTGLFDASDFYVIDLDLWVRFLLHGDLFIIPEPLCSFRVAPGSASIRVASTQSKDYRNFIAKLERTGLYGLSRMDRWLGIMNAWKNKAIRQVLYQIVR